MVTVGSGQGAHGPRCTRLVGAQGSQHLTLSVPTLPNDSVFLPKYLGFAPTAPAEQVPRGTLISLQMKVSRVMLLSGHYVNSQIVFSSV